MQLADVVLRHGTQRRLLAQLREQLHVGPEVLRYWRPRDVHSRYQRLLGVRPPRGLRHAPNVHRSCGRQCVHVYDRPGVLGCRGHVHEHFGVGDVRDRCARVHLSNGVIDLCEPDVRRRDVLRSLRTRAAHVRGRRDWPRNLLDKRGLGPGGPMHVRLRRKRVRRRLCPGRDGVRGGQLQ